MSDEDEERRAWKGGLTGKLAFTCCVERRGLARPCQGGRQIKVTKFALAELDAAKHDFGSALPSAFSEVGIHTLK